jgi:hypothetical protein
MGDGIFQVAVMQRAVGGPVVRNQNVQQRQVVEIAREFGMMPCLTPAILITTLRVRSRKSTVFEAFGSAALSST